MYAPVILPAALINPLVRTLPGVVLPVRLTLVPVIAPPTTEAAVTPPVTLRLVPVAAPIFGVVSAALALTAI